MTTLDVRDYGATGDGQSDDTQAIQDAIDDATDGDTVYVPEGTYLVSKDESKSPGSQPLLLFDGDIHADNLTFRGDGPGTVILRDTFEDSYNMIRVTNPGGWTLKLDNFVLDGNTAESMYDESASSGLSFRDTSASETGDMTLENVEVRNQGTIGFSIQYGGVIARYCTAHNNFGHGFSIATNKSGQHTPVPKLEHCYSHSNGGLKSSGAAIGNGFSCHGGRGVVEDCVAENHNYSKAAKTSKDAIEFTFRRFRASGNDGSHIYNSTSTPDDADVTFEDVVLENNDAYFRISSGNHTIASGSELVLSANGPDEVSESGQLFITDGVRFQADGDLYSNRAIEGEGLNAWEASSDSYIENYYHSQNDNGAIKNANIEIKNQAEAEKTDIEGVPTADEVGAWSDETATDPVDDGGNESSDGGDETAFESWTPRWESTHSDYTLVETASNKGDALLALEPESAGRHFLSWDEVGEPTDVEVVVLTQAVSDEDPLDSWCRPIARAGGSTGSETGYFTDVKPETLRIRKYIKGELSTLAETSTSSNIGKWFYLRFRVNGDQLKVRQWDFGDSEPATWDIEVTDDEISSSGLAGIGGISSDTQYWDYVSIATDGGTARVDGTDTGPNVAWVTPGDNETIQGTAPVRLAASSAAYNNDELTVEYRLNDEQWARAEYDPDSGYHEGAIDTIGASGGEHKLTARATDPGADTTSASISVEIETDTSPTIESLSVSEVGSDDQSAEFDANWRVGDADGDLRSVELVLTRESDGKIVDDVSVDISGSEASDTNRLVAREESGSEVRYSLGLTVTDRDGDTASESVPATDSKSSDQPVINHLSVSGTEYSDSDIEVSVLWNVAAPNSGIESVQVSVAAPNGSNQSVTWSPNGSKASDVDTFKIRDGAGETVDVTVSVTNTDGESSVKSTSITT